MAKRPCAICHQQREVAEMKVIPTTEAEREAMKKMGESEPQESYAYCKGCYQILSNPVTGLSLIKGTAQVQARRSGVNPEVAERAAERFAAKLLKGARRLV